jgi:uncharacterized membrane protein YccC
MWPRAWLDKAVPDRLTDIVPDWLVATARLQHAPVPWADMVRAALAICVPLAAGILGGDRSLGSLVALGGLLAVVVDVGGPMRIRLKRVGSAAAGGAAGLAIGSLIHGRGWMAVLALVVVAGVSALISSFGAIGSVTGLQLLVYAAVCLGPLGSLRPWWHTALGFLLGSVWALLLIVAGWLVSPRAAEQRSVAAVYRALGRALRAIGAPGCAPARLAVTEALNEGYDSLLTARSMVGGRDRRLYRLVAELNQAHLISEAMTRLTKEGTRVPPRVVDAMDEYADRIENHTRAPRVPQLDGSTPGTLLLRDALAGLASMMSRNWSPADPLPPVPSPYERLRTAIDAPAMLERLTGRLTWIYTIRLMVSIGVAAVVSEVIPLQRSYWVVLTVAIVLKPDFGSVFARAVQRGVGTIIGAVLGAAILAVVPYGPWLLAPFGLLAALLPYGRSRNFGLLAIFLTPVVVLLIDLLAPGGWRLAEDRLIDTVIGCAIALLVGYAPWPMSWQAHLPDNFAEAIRDLCRYTRWALTTSAAQDGLTRAAGQGVTQLPARSQLGRSAYRALSDMRTEFQRTMSEPPPVSRQARAWWPAVAELEEVADAVTALSVAMGRGALAPRQEAVMQLLAALDAIADAVQAGVAPNGVASLPEDEALAPVTDAVRAVLGVIASPPRPPAARPAAAAAP